MDILFGTMPLTFWFILCIFKYLFWNCKLKWNINWAEKYFKNEVALFGDSMMHDLISDIEDLEIHENSNCSYSFSSSSQSDMNVHEELKKQNYQS